MSFGINTFTVFINNLTDKMNTPEGTDKAAARAQRKAAKKQNKGKPDALKKDVVSQKTEKNISEVIPPAEPEKIKKEIENKNEQKSEETAESKAELRAKRRAIQEIQRLAKASGGGKVTIAEPEKIKKECENKNEKKSEEPAESKADLRAKRRAKQEKKTQIPQSAIKTTKTTFKRISPRRESISVVTGKNFEKQVQLFNHLYVHHSTSITKHADTVFGLHSSIIRLGVQYMSHSILGSNARCLALLSAVKNLLVDYQTPSQEEFCRSFEATLQASTNYLQKCRPLAVSMTNAVRHIKRQLTQIDTNWSDREKKNTLNEAIETYIRDEIGMADKAISITVQKKITKGDVILTYGW